MISGDLRCSSFQRYARDMDNTVDTFFCVGLVLFGGVLNFVGPHKDQDLFFPAEIWESKKWRSFCSKNWGSKENLRSFSLLKFEICLVGLRVGPPRFETHVVLTQFFDLECGRSKLVLLVSQTIMTWTWLIWVGKKPTPIWRSL